MSKIIKIVNGANQKVIQLSKAISQLNKEYNDLLNQKPIQESFNRLALLFRETEEMLTHPKFTISTLGTTSSGKSTFVNGLLGLMLAPMDADELSAGTLKFQYDELYTDTCYLTIDSTRNTKYWENHSSEKIHKDVYENTKSIMHLYRKLSLEEDLPIPQITVKTLFSIGNNPELLGLDKNAKIEIIDLPGLRTISDSENLKIIQDNIRSSFIVILINYENLYNKEAVNKIYEELKEIKDSIGSTASMLFILNKIDRRNQTDKSIIETINDCKKRIKEKLQLKEPPEVIPFNSYLFFHLQVAKFAYEKLNRKESSLSEYNWNETIKNSIKILFKDQANVLTSIEEKSESALDLIHSLKVANRKNLVPDYKLFQEFYELCLEECGAVILFQTIIDRTQNSLKELILFPATFRLLEELKIFINLLENSISTGRIDSQKEIEEAKKKLEIFSLEIKEKIEELKFSFERDINEAIQKISSSDDSSQVREGIRLVSNKLKSLDQITDMVSEINYSVDDNTIEPIKEGFEKQVQASDLCERLIQEYKWKVTDSKKLKNSFHALQLHLYNDKRTIENGKEFEFKKSDSEEEEKIQSLNGWMDVLNQNLREAMDEHIQLEMQKRIDDFVLKVNSSLTGYKQEIKKELQSILNRVSNQFILPDMPEESLQRLSYNSSFINKIHYNEIEENLYETKKFQTGTRTVNHPYFVEESYREYERPWYFLWLIPVPVIRTKTVTKYRPVEFPVYQNEEYRKVKYPSVMDLAIIWQNTLTELKKDLWEDIGLYIITILKNSLESHQTSIDKVMEQIRTILEIREREIVSEEQSKKERWNEVEKLNENIISMVRAI